MRLRAGLVPKRFHNAVMPAEAGIQPESFPGRGRVWTPASAGVTRGVVRPAEAVPSREGSAKAIGAGRGHR